MPTVKSKVLRITAKVRVLSERLKLKADFRPTVAFKGLYHSARIMETSNELGPHQTGIQTIEIISADPISQGWQVGAKFKMCDGPDIILAEGEVLTMDVIPV